MNDSNGSKRVQEAEIIINDKKIKIYGKERVEAWEFSRSLNEEETQRLINKLEEKMYKIDRKLTSRGYFFNDEIDNFTYESEIIVYILNNVFGKTIEAGKKYGQGGKAIYYDTTHERIDGRVLENMVEDLYEKHYGKN